MEVTAEALVNRVNEQLCRCGYEPFPYSQPFSGRDAVLVTTLRAVVTPPIIAAANDNDDANDWVDEKSALPLAAVKSAVKPSIDSPEIRPSRTGLLWMAEIVRFVANLADHSLTFEMLTESPNPFEIDLPLSVFDSHLSERLGQTFGIRTIGEFARFESGSQTSKTFLSKQTKARVAVEAMRRLSQCGVDSMDAVSVVLAVHSLTSMLINAYHSAALVPWPVDVLWFPLKRFIKKKLRTELEAEGLETIAALVSATNLPTHLLTAQSKASKIIQLHRNATDLLNRIAFKPSLDSILSSSPIVITPAIGSVAVPTSDSDTKRSEPLSPPKSRAMDSIPAVTPSDAQTSDLSKTLSEWMGNVIEYVCIFRIAFTHKTLSLFEPFDVDRLPLTLLVTVAEKIPSDLKEYTIRQFAEAHHNEEFAKLQLRAKNATKLAAQLTKVGIELNASKKVVLTATALKSKLRTITEGRRLNPWPTDVSSLTLKLIFKPVQRRQCGEHTIVAVAQSHDTPRSLRERAREFVRLHAELSNLLSNCSVDVGRFGSAALPSAGSVASHANAESELHSSHAPSPRSTVVLKSQPSHSTFSQSVRSWMVDVIIYVLQFKSSPTTTLNVWKDIDPLDVSRLPVRLLVKKARRLPAGTVTHTILAFFRASDGSVASDAKYKTLHTRARTVMRLAEPLQKSGVESSVVMNVMSLLHQIFSRLQDTNDYHRFLPWPADASVWTSNWLKGGDYNRNEVERLHSEVSTLFSRIKLSDYQSVSAYAGATADNVTIPTDSKQPVAAFTPVLPQIEVVHSAAVMSAVGAMSLIQMLRGRITAILTISDVQTTINALNWFVQSMETMVLQSRSLPPPTSPLIQLMCRSTQMLRTMSLNSDIDSLTAVLPKWLRLFHRLVELFSIRDTESAIPESMGSKTVERSIEMVNGQLNECIRFMSTQHSTSINANDERFPLFDSVMAYTNALVSAESPASAVIDLKADNGGDDDVTSQRSDPSNVTAVSASISSNVDLKTSAAIKIDAPSTVSSTIIPLETAAFGLPNESIDPSTVDTIAAVVTESKVLDVRDLLLTDCESALSILQAMRRFFTISLPQSKQRITAMNHDRQTWSDSRRTAYTVLAKECDRIDGWYSDLMTTKRLKEIKTHSPDKRVAVEQAIRILKVCHRSGPALFDGLAIPNLSVRINGDITQSVPIRSIDSTIIRPTDSDFATQMEKRKRVFKTVMIAIGTQLTAITEKMKVVKNMPTNMRAAVNENNAAESTSLIATAASAIDDTASIEPNVESDRKLREETAAERMKLTDTKTVGAEGTPLTALESPAAPITAIHSTPAVYTHASVTMDAVNRAIDRALGLSKPAINRAVPRNGSLHPNALITPEAVQTSQQPSDIKTAGPPTASLTASSVVQSSAASAPVTVTDLLLEDCSIAGTLLGQFRQLHRCSVVPLSKETIKVLKENKTTAAAQQYQSFHMWCEAVERAQLWLDKAIACNATASITSFRRPLFIDRAFHFAVFLERKCCPHIFTPFAGTKLPAMYVKWCAANLPSLTASESWMTSASPSQREVEAGDMARALQRDINESREQLKNVSS